MTDESRFSEKLLNAAVVLVLVIGLAALAFAAKNLFVEEPAPASAVQTDHFGSGGLTEYDLALAKEIMDKDGDGVCDSCGMSVEMCIQNGQVQCSMGDDGNDFHIGPLDTTKQKHHYHADFKIFLNEVAVDFNQEKYFVKSRFVHVENDPQGDSGEVLHMHAEGVPLWMFFESLGMRFGKDCFVIDTGEQYCNDNDNRLKFYVNGQPSSEYGDYVFADGDKILISYGSPRQDMSDELVAVTDYAKNH